MGTSLDDKFRAHRFTRDQISVRVPVDVLEAVDALALKHGITRTEVVAVLLAHGLELVEATL
jgi:hypothetical protein